MAKPTAKSSGTADKRLAAIIQPYRRVLVITPLNSGCYRELIQGISAYANTQGRWQLEICQPTYDFIQVIQSGQPDGVLLGLIDDPALEQQAVQLSPAIVATCRGYIRDSLHIPSVEADDLAVGKMGAEYLMGKGFRHYAYVGEASIWSDVRKKGFIETLAAAGYSAREFKIGTGLTLQRPVPISPQYGPLDQWLRNQPKPLAVMACNDNTGRVISRFCLELDLRVPDDVAILGVDNDDLSTAISNPPLSSVNIPWRAMGRAASLLMDRIIDGEQVPPIEHLIAPTGILERQSTSSMAIEDEQVRIAARFIRDHCGSQITVDEVVDQADTTRRALERKFRKVLGRTPLEEIRRCRIERARVLLTQTDLTIKQVAKQSGFGSLTWFTTAFADITGQSPASYRRDPT